jgi:chromosome partitioning protein
MISPAHIIVFWNIKTGSGTSTTAMHVAIGLLRLGYKVASIDLDARQSTLTRYITNRFKNQTKLPSSIHISIEEFISNTLKNHEEFANIFLSKALSKLRPHFDFIIIDTPCPSAITTDPPHSYSDTLITMINGPLPDPDLIARAVDGIAADWIVLGNRSSFAETDELFKLSNKLGFRPAPGLSERSIFPELFPKGLTLLDLKEDPDSPLTLSAMMARQEVRQILRVLHPQKFKGYPHIRTIRK